jgi:predicted O-methyltransferase YrrM
VYERSPYADFNLRNHPEDMQGWNSHDNVFRDLIVAVEPRRIIEVGVWKGAASIHMAKIVRELDLRCEVLCIDTWLGSPEHFLADRDGDRYKSLRLLNGYPQLFYTFLSNVIRQEVANYIVPLPMTSESAIVILKKLSLKADIIHIDAAHEYDPALRDFRNYWPLLSERGVLIGDDYLAKRSVTRAADNFAQEVDRPLCGFFPKCVIAKSSGVVFGVEV